MSNPPSDVGATLAQVADAVRAAIGRDNIAVRVDFPESTGGWWIVDFYTSAAAANVMVGTVHRRIGVTRLPSEYGAGPDEMFDTWQEAAARVVELLQGKTQ